MSIRHACGSYSYDANGLMATRRKSGQADWNFTWTRSNMVKWIFDGLDGSEYSYDGANSRIMEIRKEDGQAVEKKIFCPGFEQFFDKETATDKWKAKLIRVHIGAPDGVAGVYEYTPGKTDMANARTLTLLFTDHLGSIDLSITIPGASLLTYAPYPSRHKYSYNPWGQRRNANTWTGEATVNTGDLDDQHTDRGFTGHEMLDELGLINMNARIYDPLLGRFLSADTIVQNAGSLQSYNRYSYCDNNPLSRIDPTGHSWLSKAFKSIGKFFKKYWKAIVAVVIAVVTAGVFLALYYSTTTLAGGFSLLFGGGAWTGSILTGFTFLPSAGLGAMMAAGAISGFVSGFANTGGCGKLES